MCESLLRHTPEQLCRFIDRMAALRFNTLIVQYDYGFRHYQDIIKEKCQQHNIDVTLMVFGPRTFFALSKCPPEYFALDDDGKPFTSTPECETWPCFKSDDAFRYFKRGAEKFLKHHVPDWIKRVHMRSGDGWMTCRCPKCRDLMPGTGWHRYTMAFARLLKKLRPDLEAESDVYVGRYDISIPAKKFSDIDCVMYDTFGHHPRIAIGDNPGAKANWIPVNGMDTDEFNCNSLYHFDRMAKWAKLLPGKMYIHDNTMMQTQVGNFQHNTLVMLSDLAYYREIGMRGVLFEAYEPGYKFFAKHFETLAMAMYSPATAKKYQPDEAELKFLNTKLDFSYFDGGSSPELLELLPPDEREYISICDKGILNATPESYRKLVDYTLEHQDTTDVCFIGVCAAKRGMNVSRTLDFSDASEEAKKLLSYRKLWDYMEQLPDHASAREQVIEIMKNLRDKVKAR